MAHSAQESDGGHATRTVAGVVLSLAAGALLFWGFVLFVFYGYCEESCDEPPWSFWPALGAALPYMLIAVLLMGAACYLFMLGGRRGPPSFVRAAVLGIVSSAAFIAGLLLVGVALVKTNSETALLLGAILGVPLWIAATIAVTTRAGARRD